MTTAVAEYELIANDPELYANLVTIAPKTGPRIPFPPNEAQLELNRLLMAQHAAGKPMRAIALKARQVGVSTWIQLMMLQRCSTRQGHQAISLAHNVKTGGKLYRMAHGMYGSLPDESYLDAAGIERPLKVPIRSHRRQRYLHFAQTDHLAWLGGELWPDSEYDVDVAEEFDAGRGGTFHSCHVSEAAFFGRAEAKLAALKSAVPSEPDTLFVIESTANGHNVFHNEWQTAVNDPDSEYAAFFWPWWKHAEYRKPFLNDSDRERFKLGEGPWGEDEPMLRERFGLDFEQLHWRRFALSNLVSGEGRGERLATFRAEYPATADEAFIGSGSRVFDAENVSVLIQRTEEAEEESPPARGKLRARKTEEMPTRGGGMIEAPLEPYFVDASELPEGERAPWTFWCPAGDGLEVPNSCYVMGVDVSGGEVETEGGESALHAIEVIDHRTGEQVAEYASRVDPHLVLAEIYMAAQLFCPRGQIGTEEGAWVAIERTGGYGLAMLHALAKDLWYPRIYRSRRKAQRGEKSERALGWNTSPRTKPQLITLAQKLLAAEETGIHSPALASEMQTYVRDEKGKTEPERGSFADRLMAWMIAQQVRQEIAPDDIVEGEGPEPDSGVVRTWRPRDSRTGY